MRKITSFEFELDDLFKEGLWQYEEEEDLNKYFEEAGYDSNIIMFVMGLELYCFLLTIMLLVISFVVTNCLMFNGYCDYAK